jgi:subtilisin family serine protease
MTATRRRPVPALVGLLAVAALAGLLAAAGLLALAGLALAAPAGTMISARTQPVPNPGEWWFARWQVRQRIWPLTEGGGVTVAVLDTGVQASLPDLRGAVLSGGDMTGAGGRGDTDGNAGQDGHGTAVAALIAGQGAGVGIVGIAPRSKILPVTVGSEGPVSASAVAAAIRFAVRHGAQVVNMSFGIQVATPGGCDPVLQAAVAYALARDVVLVAAAGDANLIHGPSEPGSCAGVLTAGGVEPGGSLWRDSTREPYVAVAAPADRMTFEGRDGRYSTTAWGTSFSSALVAGAAALVRSRYPDMPWYQVDQRLIDTSVPAGRPVPNDGYGYGVVNPARAVDASAYPVRASAPDPVLASVKAWLATPRGRGPAASGLSLWLARGGQSSPGGASQPGMTMEQIVITAVASVCVFVAVLVFVLRMSSRRQARPGSDRRPGRWEEKTWSFGPEKDGEYGEAAGYGRPPGYGPPPLWTEPRYDPPAWR